MSFISTSFCWGLACKTLLVVIYYKSRQHILSLNYTLEHKFFAELQAHPPFLYLVCRTWRSTTTAGLTGIRYWENEVAGTYRPYVDHRHLIKPSSVLCTHASSTSYNTKIYPSHQISVFAPFFVPAYNDLPIVPCIIYIYIYIYTYVYIDVFYYLCWLSLSLMSKREITDIWFTFHQCEILPTNLVTTLSIHTYTNIDKCTHTQELMLYMYSILHSCF